MSRRIGFWAVSGFAVALAWVIFGIATAPNYNIGQWTIAAITAPASLLGRAIPLSWYWFILLNAAAYALLGFGAELFRRDHR